MFLGGGGIGGGRGKMVVVGGGWDGMRDDMWGDGSDGMGTGKFVGCVRDERKTKMGEGILQVAGWISGILGQG